ncbi:hypothetical protein P10159_2032 [Citrobacter portucalensis]|nr:hypothetical protein P10159_2032 [Citrobacter portucalensis]
MALSLIRPTGKVTWLPDGAIAYPAYGKDTWLPEMLRRPDKA